MIKYIYILLLFTTLRFCDRDPENPNPKNISLEEKWSTEGVLKTPESVLYDHLKHVIYVSNINARNPSSKDGDGFISTIKPNGKIENLKWITGLNDPKGLGLWLNKLYVADIDQLVEIDVRHGKITNRYTIPGALFLNDVTIDLKGTVYVSDSNGTKVYQLKNNTISVFVEGNNVNGPNGLLAEVNKLIMASVATGEVKFVNYKTKAITPWTSGIPNADGVTRDAFGNHFISNWQGEIYHVFASGDKVKILDTKAEGVNAADISYMPAGNMILVPTFFNNRVVAYQIKYERNPE